MKLVTVPMVVGVGSRVGLGYRRQVGGNPVPQLQISLRASKLKGLAWPASTYFMKVTYILR